MMLIADSGATKTDWCLVRGKEILQRFSAKGISPVYQSEEEIALEIKEHVFPMLTDTAVGAIHFYGTGCIPEKIPLVRNAIYRSFPIDVIHVYSDLIAAAHSLCGHDHGIACILGTGSNSCEWDGEKIRKQTSPLGFILGDEGSGAALGKQLVADALKNQLTPGLKEKLLEEYALTPALIIEKVYRQPFPSRFLASLSPFLHNHLEDASLRRIVTGSFNAFFERNVMQYDYRNQDVHFVGSVAWHYADLLKEVATHKGIRIGEITQSPMAGLIRYHHTEDVETPKL
ncbi:MAG: ATPase [Porphyromonadaceae bacterium]|nr:ATPase [Porphyromonadaceae bacterium]